MRRAIQTGLLGAYRVVFARGLLHSAWGRNLFGMLYCGYKSAFEAGPLRALRAYALPGSTIIDVDANIGFFTRRFADWTEASGRVVALEPERENFARLTRMVARCGLDGRVIAHRAVADAGEGVVDLVVNPGHPGDHRIATGPMDPEAPGETVPAMTLDRLASEDLPRVSLVKIDVQGAELRVLEGARHMIARDRPAFFVEIDPAALAAFGASVDALFAFFTGLGYRPHRLTRHGIRPVDRAEIDALLGRRAYCDLLFLPSDGLPNAASAIAARQI